MPLTTKCQNDDYSDILQLQALATGATKSTVCINNKLVVANSITTIATATRRHCGSEKQRENFNYDQQHPYSIGDQTCSDFLCCQTHCHQQKHQLQRQHHPLLHCHYYHQQIQAHPSHSQNGFPHRQHHHHHDWRRSSLLFPYPPTLNISTSSLSPSLLPFQSSSTLSANAGKLCSKSCTNKSRFSGGGGGCLRLFDLCRASSVRKLHFVIFILLNLLLRTCCGQLLINVQNQGGEVIQESITSNISEDLITLEFQKTDGTLITQIIDFRNEVRILKTLVLGEEERGQNLYQVMCFVTKFNKGDFISSDAMAKLRQKNPSTIRTPEDDKGKDTFIMTSWVHLNRSQPISRHLISICGEAPDATYVRDVDLKAWSELPGSSISSLEAATDKFPDTLSSRCNEVSSLWAPCICTLETCIGWYPCGLKYCKGKVIAGDTSAAAAAAANYRCGIKTCRKCSQYSYYVRQKQQCLWDE